MRFAEAPEMVPGPFRVGGTPLRPFCLGHHLLLRRMGLPFAGCAQADCGPEDILMGVAVCAASYEYTLEAVLDGDWPRIIETWRRRSLGPWWKHRRIDWEQSEVDFRLYLDDGYRMPPTWQYHHADVVELTAPWECLLRVRLIRSGFTESEVMNKYLPQAWFDYFTCKELEQFEHIKDLSNWRRIFYRQHHAEEMNGE